MDLETKMIHLSLNQNILASKAIEFRIPIGQILTCQIKFIDQSIGLIASLESGEEGFIHISRCSDLPIKRFSEHFNLGTTHQSRIISLDYLDGLYTLSLEKKVIAKQFLRHEDILVGMFVEAQVTKLDQSGVLVNMSDTINALIPTIHQSDIQLTNPGKKFRVGAMIKCRVLNVDVEKKRVILTCKKSLLQSKYEICGTFDVKYCGMLTNGTIKKVDHFGVVISFFGSVQAICLKGDLGTNSENWRSEFVVGQVVLCRIMSCDPEEKKMRVTMKTQSHGDIEKAIIGSHEKAIIMAKENESVIVQLEKLGLLAILPKTHLSDDRAECEKEFKQMKKGSSLDVLIVDKDSSNGKVIVSMKCSLFTSLKELSDTNLVPGMIVDAFVSKITDSFCLVKTACGDRLIIMKKNVSQQFTTNISDVLFVGQSVKAKVTTIHEDLRMEATLKLTTTTTTTTTNKREEVLNPKEEQFEIGQTLKGKVVSIRSESGVVIELPGRKFGKIHLCDISDTFNESPTSIFKVGMKIDCVVMDIAEDGKIDLSTRESNLSKNMTMNQDQTINTVTQLKVGQKVRGYVKNMSDNGCFVSLSKSLTARIKISELSDAYIKDFTGMFKTGQLITATILRYLIYLSLFMINEMKV